MRNLASKPWCISVWQAEQNITCSSLSLFALCFWQCQREQLELKKKKLPSYVGPTHKASWEEEPCATVVELLLDPKDASEERKKEKGQQVSLAAAERISISISCPAACPAVPYGGTRQVRNCFSTGQFYIKPVPFPRPDMEARPNFLGLVWTGKKTSSWDHPVVYTFMGLFSKYSIVKCSKFWDRRQRRTVIRKK